MKIAIRKEKANASLSAAASACKAFLYKNRWGLLLAFAFTLVCYGFMLTHYTLTIDEETWIRNTDPELIETIWLRQGRFGLYLFDAVFTPLGRYVPFIWDFLGIVFWFCGGVLFCFVLTRYYPGHFRFSVFAFAAMFTTVPFAVGEILSYSMFSLQQGLAMLLVAASAALTFFCFHTFRWTAALGAAVLLFAGVSFYQAFATVYITAIAAYLCLSLLCKTGGRVIRNITGSIGIFAVGVGAYFLINRYITTVLYPGSDTYLENNFIGWGGGDPLGALAAAAGNMLDVILGRGVYGGKVLLLLTGLTALTLLVRLWLLLRERQWREIPGLLIGFAVVILAPFSMLLAFAQPELVGRTLLALPLSLSIEVFLIINTARLLPRPRAAGWVAGLLVTAVLLSNAAYMNQFFYSSYRVYTEDQAKAAQIMCRLSAAGMHTTEKPVVFVGALVQNAYLPDDCSAGGSFFSWDGGNIARMRDFLNAEGYTILPATTEQIQRGAELAEDMPCWPAEGCMAEAEDFILVKFSDPTTLWKSVNGAGSPES